MKFETFPLDELITACESYFYLRGDNIKYIDYDKLFTLPYKWFLVTGARSIGKTYGGLKYIIKNCLKKDCEFIYVVRTKELKDNGAIGEATSKVLQNEFKDKEFLSTKKNLFNVIKNQKGKEEKILLGHCIALSEVHKIKFKSFPKVKWIVFDEFIFENKKGMSNRYVGGYDEPDLLLNLYHTADREEDKIRCLLIANPITSINPYYIHDFFNVPQLKSGEVFKNKSVIAIHFKESDELKEDRENNDFINQVKGLEYDKYIQGDYMEDANIFIKELPSKLFKLCNIVIDNKFYSVNYCEKDGLIYIAKTKDKTFYSIALDTESHSESVKALDKKESSIKYLKESLINSRVRYNDLETKKLVEKSLYKLL